MEDSIIYGLLFRNYIFDYRKQLEKDESDKISKWVLESREKLEKNLSAEQLELVDSYKHFLTLREEDIDVQTEIRILNYGIKIGMELQKAFDGFED